MFEQISGHSGPSQDDTSQQGKREWILGGGWNFKQGGHVALLRKGYMSKVLKGVSRLLAFLLIFPYQNTSFRKQEISFFICYITSAWSLSGPQKSLLGEWLRMRAVLCVQLYLLPLARCLTHPNNQ